MQAMSTTNVPAVEVATGVALLTLAGLEMDPQRLALVQEIQHHPLSGKPVHVDLHEVSETEKVTVKVPVVRMGPVTMSISLLCRSRPRLSAACMISIRLSSPSPRWFSQSSNSY